MTAEMNKTTKVGIISCSGEELPAGTISRSAVRRVLEVLRPHDAVTLCLPLFLAGNEGERNFARTHPTITIDGCDKQCARFGTERHGGPVARSLVVSDILGDRAAACSRSLRRRTEADEEAIAIVAARIAGEIDKLMKGKGLIEVKVFGAEPPCVKCKQTEQEAKKAAARFPGQVRVEKLSALSPEGVAFGFAMTPAVVVNGKVVSQGRVPQVAELEGIFRAELGG